MFGVVWRSYYKEVLHVWASMEEQIMFIYFF